MEYLVIILLIVVGIYKFDFNQNATKGNNLLYGFIFILMVLMSGFAYRVGADFVNYVYEFESDYLGALDVNLFQLSNRQPGWVLLNYFLYITTKNFYVLKLIQAVFFQYAVFITIKRFTPYRYTTLLLFFVFLFPQANFNVLRESFSIGFFLLGLPSLIEKNFKVYYLYILMSVLFHYGSIPLLFLPLIYLIDFKSPRKVIIISAILFIVAIGVSKLNITNVLLRLIASTNSNELSSISEYYLLTDKYEVVGVSNIGKLFLFFFINVFPLFYLSGKDNYILKRLIPLAFVYVFVDLLNYIIPILYRYKDYTYLLYHIVLSFFLVDYSVNRLRKHLLLICVLFSVYLYSIRSYFSVNEFYGEKLLVQYYPYYSVVSKGVSPIRERTFYY